MSNSNLSTFKLSALAPAPEFELVGQPLDKRIVGELNRRKILSMLFRFGWLTSRMVAGLVWGQASQAWPMARRTLKTMQND